MDFIMERKDCSACDQSTKWRKGTVIGKGGRRKKKKPPLSWAVGNGSLHTETRASVTKSLWKKSEKREESKQSSLGGQRE